MAPIRGLGPADPITPTSSRGPARGAGFRVAEDNITRSAAGTGEAEEVADASLAGLLALQEEVDAGPVRDREARRRGRDLLAELAALQRDLLAGPPDVERLARLIELADAVPEAADPRLREAVEAIILRARVEAARYGRG